MSDTPPIDPHMAMQVRPGRWMTLLLATVGVSAVGVGATACLSLLFMWLFVGPVPSDSHAAKLSSPLLDETLSEEPDSGAELDYGECAVLSQAVCAAWILLSRG